ncbi:hypothetical protein L1D37_20475 [Vibrio sp. Isolate33]|uniref:hypothetical protein n=1 Tax=Vibrio sp. Isolate33 TaxID=2908539 RepID=UPI001EFD6803|nr:hypothetical protein [Vibrio sp. Isolate33]MCG9546124.1 hypothetical protein [Vibrio sp. Isolate33]
MKNAKADASLYLLTGLLQRLESGNPGLVDGMRKGVQSDKDKLSPETPDHDHILDIFYEAELLLTRIQSLNKQ